MGLVNYNNYSFCFHRYYVLVFPFFFLQKQLVAQKIHIEENEDRDTGLEQRHNKEDPDCIKAKVPLGDLDLYDGTYITLESKDIR